MSKIAIKLLMVEDIYNYAIRYSPKPEGVPCQTEKEAVDVPNVPFIHHLKEDPSKHTQI